MDFLLAKGYRDAAQTFSREANMPLPADETMQERIDIRDAIHSGDVQTAIEKLNDLDPSVSFQPFSAILSTMIITGCTCTTLIHSCDDET